MSSGLDAALRRAAEALPGVVAAVTDRDATIYEGAAGVRALGADAPMTLDTVLTTHSTTKPVTATAVLQLVEAGGSIWTRRRRRTCRRPGRCR